MNRPLIQERIASHRRFWKGEGPSLLLISPESGPLYDTTDYARRFVDPQQMWEAEIQRAQLVVDWPTDGIPTVRPNLGVIFVPAIAGQSYELKNDQMPWPGEPLAWDAIRAARRVDVAEADLMRRAEAFYQIHRERGGADIAPYHADTQGVFDIAHLLYGDGIFTAMAGDPAEQAQIFELLEISLDLYLKVSRRLKELLGEPAGSMIHGHGTSQGVFFPTGGVRAAEDTAILLSAAMIRRFIMRFIRRSLAPFDGGSPEVLAIDLGNPEKYDPRWVLERCAASGTVFYSRLPALDGEDALTYVRRVGTLVRETKARSILRATVQPRSREEASEMLALWRELTQPDAEPRKKNSV
ncbi:MAG: hypothetical protein NT167_14080 [Verrucomicrobia bacterium]|nr:hypothetical protein [Verrucomicrobiota bacterium]